MERSTRRNRAAALWGLALLVLAGAGQLAARNFKSFGGWYAVHVYSVVVSVAGRFWGLLPVSAAELGLYVLGAVTVWYVVRHGRDWKAVGSRAVFVTGAAAFLYTYQCGINYYRQPFSSELKLEVRESSVQELAELCRYLTEKVNETADDTPYEYSWTQWGREAMERLGETYPGLSGYYPRPKPVTISWILSVQQLSGIYSPFTVEANYNRQMTAYNIPHTICHELSHLRGYMREDEANFIGYLACIGSERQCFQYSGYLTGWVYAGNALAGQDMETYRELYQSLLPQVQQDLRENSEFWNRYEGRVAEVSNQMNDAYLKINDQKEGVRTYGRMVDLMLVHYRQAENEDAAGQEDALSRGQ